MKLSEPYQERPIRPLGTWEPEGWRLKVYGIAYEAKRPSDDLVKWAKRVASRRLPVPAVTEDRYGVGFLGVHAGRGENLVFLDWWAAENELHHHVWTGPAADPTVLSRASEGAAVACVWDLAVLSHEREAWIEHVLDNPDGPDLEAYMADRLDALV